MVFESDSIQIKNENNHFYLLSMSIKSSKLNYKKILSNSSTDSLLIDSGAFKSLFVIDDDIFNNLNCELQDGDFGSYKIMMFDEIILSTTDTYYILKNIIVDVTSYHLAKEENVGLYDDSTSLILIY